MSEHVRVERGDGVLAITLARPERRNAITIAMYAALAEALEQARDDPAIRVVTFRGEGKDFAAGNDLADFLNAGARETGDIPVWRFLRALVACESRSSPRFTAIAWASAPRCSSTATSSSPKRARGSHCRSSTWGWVPEAASSVLRRGWWGGGWPRATFCWRAVRRR